jgi:anaerobic dimethyl sulfoxide reductase subunit B (iron-sulfur subunit)
MGEPTWAEITVNAVHKPVHKPYGAPQFGAEDNAKMQKCDHCLERLLNGSKPICVAACPMRALDAGPIDELLERYGEHREAEGFIFSSELMPSILFKSKEVLRRK